MEDVDVDATEYEIIDSPLDVSFVAAPAAPIAESGLETYGGVQWGGTDTHRPTEHGTDGLLLCLTVAEEDAINQ